MSDCRDNQDVGLEAATIQRVRNSSLVKWPGADNVTGLKQGAEATDFEHWLGVVGERSQAGEAAAEASRGGLGSENAGTSNERSVRNASAECPRVPE